MSDQQWLSAITLVDTITISKWALSITLGLDNCKRLFKRVSQDDIQKRLLAVSGHEGSSGHVGAGVVLVRGQMIRILIPCLSDRGGVDAAGQAFRCVRDGCCQAPYAVPCPITQL